MTTLRRALTEKYPNRAELMISRFEEAVGEPCTWTAISKPNLNRFVKFLQEKVSRNSAKQYASMLKSVINLYSDELSLPSGWEKQLSLKSDASQHIYLTIDEINRIISYIPSSQNECFVRNCFIISCLTGARHSDAMQMTLKNIHKGWCSYVSIKTHIESRIPSSAALVNILNENENMGASKMGVSDVTYNEIIRKICEKVGICDDVKVYASGEVTEGKKYEFVASHTARRSFATNLYLFNIDGVFPFDISQISKMMGHADIQMTMGYIMESRPINESGIAFFKQFK